MRKKYLTLKLLLAIAISNTAIIPMEANSISSKNKEFLTNAPDQSNYIVKGTVTDTSGEPLIGVSVSVVGSNVGTITNYDGEYSINVGSEGKSLTFSYIGHKTVTQKVTSQTMNVKLQEDVQMMDEVVVVGYGVQKKENLTGAIGTVDVAKTMDSRPVSNIAEALQGSMPGLTITSISGDIGETPTIKIRGGNPSPNSANGGQALVLLDNVEIPDITMINPDDIESITILKDAGSAAVYGARGANGVILVTSKNKSRVENIRISYSNNFAFRTPTTKPEQLPAWQQADINLQGVNNSANALSYIMVGQIKVDANAVEKMKAWKEQYGNQKLGREMVYGRDFEFNPEGAFFYRDWNWYDMFVKKWSNHQNHNLNLSGGGEKISYNTSLAFMKRDGMIKINTDDFNRYNFNLSLSSKVSKAIDLRFNSMFVRTEHDKPYVYGSSLYDYLYYLYRWQPFYPYGTYEDKEFRSAMTDLRQATMTKRSNDYIRMGGGITIKPFKKVTIDSDFYYTTTYNRFKEHGNKIYGYNTYDIGYSLESLANSYGDYTNSSYVGIYETNARSQGYTSNTVASFQDTYNSVHNVKVMGGTNFENSEYTFLSVNRKGLFDESLPEFGLAYGDITLTSSHTNWAIAGFFGRLNYDYDNKYLVEINGRYDGSSKFPTNDRFAYFGSYSVGYRITQENFMTPLKPYLSDMKIRASYGEVGSQDIPANTFLSTITASPNYTWMINGQYTSAFGTPSIASSRLSWEKLATYDIGVDARFLNNALGVSFDWFRKYTRNVISAGEELPSTLGGAAPRVNYGELVTPGWELSADYNLRINNGPELVFGASLADNYTKVNKWNQSISNIPAYGSGGTGWMSSSYFRKGMVLGDIWGFKTDGLFQESDFDANGMLISNIDYTYVYGAQANTPNFLKGFVKYQDLSGTGKIDKGDGTTANPGSMTIIGNALPRYEYGFSIGANYKGFDFKMFFQGVGKRHTWAAGNQVLPGFTTGEPFYKGADDYWTPENPGAFYPKPYDYAQVQKMSYSVNDRYLLNMAYLRAKTISLGYTLPRALTMKALLNKVRFYVTGENLFEFDKMKVDIDPETGIRMSGTTQDARNYGRTYPYYRSLAFGMQVVF